MLEILSACHNLLVASIESARVLFPEPEHVFREDLSPEKGGDTHLSVQEGL